VLPRGCADRPASGVRVIPCPDVFAYAEGKTSEAREADAEEENVEAESKGKDGVGEAHAETPSDSCRSCEAGPPVEARRATAAEAGRTTCPASAATAAASVGEARAAAFSERRAAAASAATVCEGTGTCRITTDLAAAVGVIASEAEAVASRLMRPRPGRRRRQVDVHVDVVDGDDDLNGDAPR
jgi:hypothetical protein